MNGRQRNAMNAQICRKKNDSNYDGNCTARHCLSRTYEISRRWIFVRLSVQYSTVQFSSVQWSAVQCSSVQYSSVKYSSVECSAVQCSAVQCSAVECSVVRCNAVQWSAVQYSKVLGHTTYNLNFLRLAMLTLVVAIILQLFLCL